MQIPKETVVPWYNDANVIWLPILTLFIGIRIFIFTNLANTFILCNTIYFINMCVWRTRSGIDIPPYIYLQVGEGVYPKSQKVEWCVNGPIFFLTQLTNKLRKAFGKTGKLREKNIWQRHKKHLK